MLDSIRMKTQQASYVSENPTRSSDTSYKLSKLCIHKQVYQADFIVCSFQLPLKKRIITLLFDCQSAISKPSFDWGLKNDRSGFHANRIFI